MTRALIRNHEKANESFRVLVERLDDDTNEVLGTTAYGPYQTEGAAKGQGKRAWKDRDFEHRVRVQRLAGTWVDIGEPKPRPFGPGVYENKLGVRLHVLGHIFTAGPYLTLGGMYRAEARGGHFGFVRYLVTEQSMRESGYVFVEELAE